MSNENRLSRKKHDKKSKQQYAKYHCIVCGRKTNYHHQFCPKHHKKMRTLQKKYA